jgi:hypothetical protein
VVYRDRGGMRLYAVPASGGPRRHLLTLHVPRTQRFSWRIAELGIDFSSNGRHALVPLAGHTAALIDLATGHSRTLDRLSRPDLSPDGREVAWVRGRGGRCDVAARSLASGRNPLAPAPPLRARRLLGLYGTSTSGALRLVARGDEHRDLAAWLLRPDGVLVTRPLPQLGIIGSREEFVLTPDEQAVVIQESGGGLARIALRARQPLPIRTSGRFDAL